MSSLRRRYPCFARLGLLGCALGLMACEPITQPAAGTATGEASTSVASATPAVDLTGRPGELLDAELARRAELVRPDDLASRDVATRRAAARVLARIGGELVRDPMLRLLSDEDDEVAAWAAYGLGFFCEGKRDATVAALATAMAARRAAERRPNSGALDPLRAIVRAVGQCASSDSETILAEWTREPSLVLDAVAALGDVATQKEKLREDTYVTLLNLAAGDAARKPTPEALYPLARVSHLPPSIVERAFEVSQARLAEPGPARVFAVRVLGRTEEGSIALLREVLEHPERFTAAERSDAARSLKRHGRDGQRALAEAFVALAPHALGPVEATALVSDHFGALLTVLESLDTVGSARGALFDAARLAASTGAPEPVLRRLSWLRCGAARLLVERKYDDELLQKCDVTVAAPALGPIGARYVVDAIGIEGASITGARHAAWKRLALEGALGTREAAVALIAEHQELDDVAEVLVTSLKAAEPGLVASAAEAIAKRPACARQRKKKHKKDEPEAEGPVRPEIAAALAAVLDPAGGPSDLEARGTLIDAAATLALEEARPHIEAFCGSTYPSLREHAQKALRKLGVEGVECREAKGDAPPTPERDHLLVRQTVVRFDTDVGELSLELDPRFAPVAVTRLVDLAKSGFFAGIVVHRAVPGFVAQLGTPTADGYGGAPLPPLRCETTPVAFDALSVGIALAGRDTGGSQFFVTHGAFPHLDGRYAWLGKATGPWAALVEGDRVRGAKVVEAD